MQKVLLKFFVTMFVVSNMVACAKKDDGAPVQTAVAPVKQTPTTPASDVKKDAKAATPDLKGGADATKPDIKVEQKVETQAETKTDTQVEVKVEQKEKQTSDQKTETKKKPQKSEVKTEDSSRKEKTAEFKGKPTGLAKDYASAGNDYLVEFLSQQMKKVKDQNIQKRNQLAAESIESIETKIDSKTGDVLVVVNRLEGKKSKQEMLGGNVGQRRATRLGGENVNLRGKFTCMDEDTSFCRTAILDLEFGKGADKAIVKAVIRKTPADFFWSRPEVSQPNANFKRIFDLFDNAERKRDEGFSIVTLVESTEIINGRSHARISIVAEDGEVISVAAPLVVPQSSREGQTSVRMERNIRFESLLDLMLIQDVKTTLQKSISNAQLVKVEAGKFMTVIFETQGAKAQETQRITVRFERIHPEVQMIENK